MDERFTDEELAFLRYARFGELPQPVRSADLVEVVETDQPDIPPKPLFDPNTQAPFGT